MADADLTGKSFGVAGVNQATNFTKSYTLFLDFNSVTEAAVSGTHSVMTIPPGEVVTGIKTVPVAAATVSSGTANVNFAFKAGTGSFVNIGSAATVTNYGSASQVVAATGMGYDPDNAGTLGFISSGTFTGLKILVEVDTLPAKEFLVKG